MNHSLVERIEKAWDQNFDDNSVIVQSPGRINLIGEHTDYNEGYVFPAAINLCIMAAMMDAEGSEECTIIALDPEEELRFNINDKSLIFPKGAWQNYVYGVVRELQAAGHIVEGFRMVFAGDIPAGAGLSSSAALENAVVFGLNAIFSLQIPEQEMILISQRAEHNFAGVQCGIMDQYASMFGRENHALLLDCRSVRSIEKQLDFIGCDLVLVNSNVKHALADSAYNERRDECRAGVAILQGVYPDLRALRDISMPQLEALIELFPPIIYDRCSYVVKENQRVLESVLALESNDLYTFGSILLDAHNDMRYLYEITCPEIDYLVDKVSDHEDLYGCRMMGGGFGGCIIALVASGSAEMIFNSELQETYSKRYGRQFEIYPIETSDGTRLI